MRIAERWPARACGACVGRRGPRARHQRIFATPAHATLSRFQGSLYLLFTTLFRDKVKESIPHIAQPIAHTTDALKTPPVPHRSRRLTPGTAIIQPRSASVLGHGVPRSSEFHSFTTHQHVQSQTQKREGQQFTTHQHVHTYHFIRKLDMDDI